MSQKKRVRTETTLPKSVKIVRVESRKELCTIDITAQSIDRERIHQSSEVFIHGRSVAKLEVDVLVRALSVARGS